MCRAAQCRILPLVSIAVVALSPMILANSAAASGQSGRERIVAIHDGGNEKVIVTTANTVRQALAAAGVNFEEHHDSIEPHIDMELTGEKYQVNIYRARPITVRDATTIVNITTSEQTPVRIAKAAGITLYNEDTVEFMTTDNLAMNGAGVTMNIDRARQRTVTQEVEIDFEVEQIRDANHPIGYKEVKTLGRKGIERVTYQIEVEGGRELARREIDRQMVAEPVKQIEVIGTKPTNPLTKSKGAHIFTDSKGVAHRETYYDLPMNVVISACGGGGYTVREDGAKVDKDGYILVAANYGNYPRCSVVETSMGPGKVYDTGGFAVRHPHGFDLATDWTKADGI